MFTHVVFNVDVLRVRWPGTEECGQDEDVAFHEGIVTASELWPLVNGRGCGAAGRRMPPPLPLPRCWVARYDDRRRDHHGHRRRNPESRGEVRRLRRCGSAL